MMSRHRTEQWLSPLALAVAMLSMPSLPNIGGAQPATEKASEPEMESRGERKLVREIKYGDGQNFCFKTPGTNMVCRTTISGTFDTGQSAVRADLIEREGDGKPRLQLFVPVGLYLQAGAKLTADQGKSYRVPYSWSLTNTCMAGNPADPQLVADMEKGEKLKLEVVDS